MVANVVVREEFIVAQGLGSRFEIERRGWHLKQVRYLLPEGGYRDRGRALMHSLFFVGARVRDKEADDIRRTGGRYARAGRVNEGETCGHGRSC